MTPNKTMQIQNSNQTHASHTHSILFNIFKFTLLALLTSVLMQLDDPIQKLFTDANQAKFEIKFSLSLFGFHLLLWLSGKRFFACGIILTFLILQMTQLGHISYVGRPLDPLTISSVLVEAGDIQSAMLGNYQEHIHVLLAVGLPYLVMLFLFWRFMPKPLNKWLTWFCFFAIFLILASKPYRATYRDLNMFLPGATRPSLYNTLDTYSYFLVHGFPSLDDAMPLAEIPKPVLTKIPSNAKTVWLIIVDSVRSDHLQVLGYERETTPNLSNWLNKGLTAKHGIATSVATAASVPLIMNTIYDPGNIKQIKSEETNLFRLAKEAGFSTYWISSQGSRVINDIGSRYIDVLIGQEDDPLLFEEKKDQAVVDFVREQTWGDKNFVVLLMRGTHAPYEVNYEKVRSQFAKWDDNPNLDRKTRNINSYDNSMLYVDSLLNELLDFIAKQPGENHVVITADHGQLLGEKNLWGHNLMEPEVARVPMLSASWNAPEGASLAEFTANNYWISHFDMSRWLAARLGTKIELPQYQPNHFFLQGKNLYGVNQYLEVNSQDPNSLQLSAPKMTRDYQAEAK